VLKLIMMFGLVVNVSNVISSLCHTVLRLEPYSSCAFKCVYCYSRWYGVSFHSEPKPLREIVGAFRDFARKVRVKGLKPIPFRLSTLVDPFPPQERHYRVTAKILTEALRHEYPLIINTKSVVQIEDSITEKLLQKLLSEDLAVLQISISTLDENIAKRIEPHAPSPIERIKAVRCFSDAPLVLRISPFIPNISPTSLNEILDFVAIVKDYGVKHVIAESLRMERDHIHGFLKALNVEAGVETYSIRNESLARIQKSLRESIYKSLSMELSKHNIGFATCKEGLFNLHTTSDCCGAYLLKDYVLRPTLYDFYKHMAQGRKTAQLQEVVEILESDVTRVCGERLRQYPRQVSKLLRYHEKRMLRTLQSPALLKQVAPHLAEIMKIESSTANLAGKL